jgi:hypothetical protein
VHIKEEVDLRIDERLGDTPLSNATVVRHATVSSVPRNAAIRSYECMPTSKTQMETTASQFPHLVLLLQSSDDSVDGLLKVYHGH